MEQPAAGEDYAMDDVDSKKDEVEPTESAPLNKGGGGEDVVDGVGTKDNDACLTPAIKDPNNKRAGGGVRGWFAKEKIKWCIAIIVAVVLLAVVLVATLLALGDSYDSYDSTPRLMILWPRPNRPDNLIYFQSGEMPHEGKEWDALTAQLDRLMTNYEVVRQDANVTECFGSPPLEGISCFFDVKLISPECTKPWNFGYNTAMPCVFLQFANITGWKPEPYVTRDMETPSLDLPKDLKSSYRPNVVYLDCEGDTIVDSENMGPVEYTPERGFKYNYFPYVGLPDYMPPMVALHFKKPKIGVAISVTCKLWAKNINHTLIESLPSGSLHFSLLID